MNKKEHSWGLIVAMLIIFFPVGIVFLVKKITARKDQYIQNGKGLKIAGIVMFCLIPVYLILALTGELQYEDGSSAVGMALVMDLVLGVGGAFAFVKGKQYIARGQRYSDCASALAAQKTVELEPMAAELKLTFDEVAKDIQWLIDTGCIQDAYIDLADRILAPKQKLRLTRSVICACCGGKNVIAVGTQANCEYCDSPL